MFQRAMRSVHRLRKGRPGQRFQHRYYRHVGEMSRQRKLVLACGATALIVGGLILMPVPGPGSLIVVLGLALLAGVSRTAARLLDRAEVLSRRLLHWARDCWLRASPALRAALVIVAVAVIAAGSYAAFVIIAKVIG